MAWLRGAPSTRYSGRGRVNVDTNGDVPVTRGTLLLERGQRKIGKVAGVVLSLFFLILSFLFLSSFSSAASSSSHSPLPLHPFSLYASSLYPTPPFRPLTHLKPPLSSPHATLTRTAWAAALPAAITERPATISDGEPRRW